MEWKVEWRNFPRGKWNGKEMEWKWNGKYWLMIDGTEKNWNGKWNGMEWNIL